MPDLSRTPTTLTQAIDDVIKALRTVYQNIVSTLERAERNHYRSQLLGAYKRRNSWKKSDIQHLRSLGVNKWAERRMERLAGKGRPVVRPVQPLEQVIVSQLNALEPLFNSASTPEKRKQAFKRWLWWPHYVEALYRGEHLLAKAEGISGPSDHAERLVGQALGMSPAKVHSICGEIRRMRREDAEFANFSAITLMEYEQWMKSGERIWDVDNRSGQTLDVST